LTLQSRVITTRKSSTPAPGDGRREMAVYRALLSCLIELERDLVDKGYIKPEERRILSREERRAGSAGNTNGRGPIMSDTNGRD
jgi:hypothetical protein